MSRQLQKKDHLFAVTASRNADFEFNVQVAEVFDDMIARSVPFYAEQQYMIGELAKKFWVPGTRIYDLGCSTGTTLAGIGLGIEPAAQLVGIDNSEAML